MNDVFLLCAIIGGTIMLLQFALTVLGIGAHHGHTGDLGGGGFDAGHHLGGAGDLSGSHSSFSTGHGEISGTSHAGGSDHFTGHDQATATHSPSTTHHDNNQSGDAPDDHHSGGTLWLFKVITFQTIVAAIAFFGIAGKAALASNIPATTALVIAIGAAFAAMHIVYYLARSLHRFNADGTVQVRRAVGQAGTVYVPIPAANAGAGKIHMNLQNRTVELQAMTTAGRLPSGAKIRVVGLLGPDTVAVEPLIESEAPSHA
jgi:hypothetical protein